MIRLIPPMARATRRLLPAGTLPVGAGLAVLGSAAYVHLAVAGHRLDPAGYSSLSVFWSILFTAGLGIFMPIEQEISRYVVADRRAGRPVGSTLLRVGAVATVAAGLPAAGLVAAAGPLADWLFDGSASLCGWLAAALAGLAAAHVSRGLLAGLGRFRRYGLQLGLDGGLRVGLVALLAVFGVDSPIWYAAVLAVAPPIAALLTLPRRLGATGRAGTSRGVAGGGSTGGTASWPVLLRGLGLLTVASLLAQLVANLGVVNARLLAPSQAALAGALLAALAVARIPLFVFASVQAPLLPGLAAATVDGDRAAFSRLLDRALVSVSLLGTAGGLAAVVVGPWLVPTVFGVPAVLSRTDVGWLAAGTLAYLWALVLGQALLAGGRHLGQAIGWTAGTAVLAAVTLAPIEAAVPTRVGCAYTFGALAAASTMALLLRRPRATPPAGHRAVPVATAGAAPT
nr:polysaccharide biosynthesis protein [Micromonospora sp. DSM 115978]